MEKDGRGARVGTGEVRRFWEAHPLSADAIPFEPGTREFFEEHNRLRALVEPTELQERIYEWRCHAGKQLLDVGCGTGFVVSLYARGGARVTGVDLTRRGVDLTRKRLEWAGLRARLAQADAERLPFKDGSFDMVTSFGVLHHTPDTARAMSEVARVLKPGGRLILMLYNRNSIANRILFPLKHWLSPAWRGRPIQAQRNAIDGAGNPLGRVISRSELRALLPGFERLEFSTGDLLVRRPALLPKAVAGWLERHWGWLLYVRADKKAALGAP